MLINFNNNRSFEELYQNLEQYLNFYHHQKQNTNIKTSLKEFKYQDKTFITAKKVIKLN